VSEFDFGVDVDFRTLVLGTMPYDLVPLDAIVRRDRQEQQDLCILLLLVFVVLQVEWTVRDGMDLLGGGPFLSQEIFSSSSTRHSHESPPSRAKTSPKQPTGWSIVN